MSDLRLKHTDSTNRAAMELAMKGAPHGSTVIADRQGSGRGRQGRSWFSPAGKNLYCSFIVRPVLPIEHYPKLTMAAGVSAAQCLGALPGIAITLKWPNDIFIGARKCGGILSEFATDHAGGPFAVVGVGINCNMAPTDLPEELRTIATSLLIEAGTAVDISSLFADLKHRFLHVIAQFEKDGFGSILAQWSRFDHFQGKKMVWVRPGGERLEGENLGPDGNGALMVRDDAGNIHRIVSGEITSAGTAGVQ